MDKSFFFFFFCLTTQIFPAVCGCGRKTNTALFSLSAAARRQLVLSSPSSACQQQLAGSWHRACWHFRSAIIHPNISIWLCSLSPCACPSVCLFVSRTPSFLWDVFKCFPFILSSQRKYLFATSEQSEMAENVFK